MCCIIEMFASVHRGSVITVTQARYACHLSEFLGLVREGGIPRRENVDSCPCSLSVDADDCSPETVAEVLETLDMFNKPEMETERKEGEVNCPQFRSKIAVQALVS